MILYPAIDLKKGKCVRLLQGKMNKQTIFNNDPLMQAKLFVNQGCQWLHVVDLDGALSQSLVNQKVIKEIIKMVKSTDPGRGGMIMGKKNIKAITIMVRKAENGLNGQVTENW